MTLFSVARPMSDPFQTVLCELASILERKIRFTLAFQPSGAAARPSMRARYDSELFDC